MGILKKEDIGKQNSIGWFGIKYFATRGRDMNVELVNCGLLTGDSHKGYKKTPLGEQYSGPNGWCSDVVEMLYKNSSKLKRSYDMFRKER